MTNALSPTMTLRDFENGYWYLDQLKNFAERIDIPPGSQSRPPDGRARAEVTTDWRI